MQEPTQEPMQEPRRTSEMVLEHENNGKISTIFGRTSDLEGPVDLEKAISSTGFGRFNVLLVLAVLPIAWVGIFDTTTSAFILASAECDLQLSFFRKGVLVGIPYVGMLSTTFLWDYLTPYTGTRNLFVLGLLADSFFNILGTAVQSYHVFLLLKFLSGILAGGPFAMTMAYMSEFHSARYKPLFTKWVGFLHATANIIPAALGFLILPLSMEVDIFGRTYTSWRIYLLIFCVPPVLGIVSASTLPESPKYLVEIGRAEVALKLLGRIYSINTGKPADSFPIKALLARRNFGAEEEKRVATWYKRSQVLFSSPYLSVVSLLGFLQFGSMLGFNTMRLWVPHLFIILNNFDRDRWTLERSPTICEMLNRRAVLPAREYLACARFDDVCLTWIVNPVIYQNSTIIASSAVVFSHLAGMVTSASKSRKQVILIAALAISVLSSFGINWAQSPPYMLTLAAAIIVAARIAGNVVAAVNVDVIPIPLRATSLGILTSLGNLGALAGNLIFSALLDLNCLVAFLGMGCLFLGCACLSFVRPNPVDKTLPTTSS